jgi:hypothetical protein
VTPTETPGPTDSPSPKPVAGLAAAPIVVAGPQGASTGTVVGAAIGGALVVVAVIGVAIRFRIVSAQLNGSPKIASWRANVKGKKRPEFEIGTNPTVVNNPTMIMRINRMSTAPTPVREEV